MPQPLQNQKLRTLTPELAPKTTGFRLKEEDRKLLSEHALQAGVSPHVLARMFVEQVLHSGGTIAQLLSLHEDISMIRQQLADLRSDVSVSTAVLLVSAGRTSSESAKAWVEKNLSQK